MNGTHPFITTTGILRCLYRAAMAASNNDAVVWRVLGTGYVVMGGGTSRIFVDRELPLNVGG